MLTSVRAWLARLKIDVLALWFCYRHARTPLAAKIVAALVVAYAFSPIDLIPDFIPVLGYLDDALLLPLGVWVALKLIPEAVLVEGRARAVQWLEERRPRPRSRLAAVAIMGVWVLLLWLAWLGLEPWLVSV